MARLGHSRFISYHAGRPKGLARRRGSRRKRRTAWYLLIAFVLLMVVSVSAYVSLQKHPKQPIILYINQGNGLVNSSNFVSMVTYASSRGFNTIFFQVYREGSLLFSTGDLATFVNESHSHGLAIFFALYFTNSSQSIPTSILNVGEDGVSLDMSTLDVASQGILLSTLQNEYHGKTAVTTTDMTSSLHPDLLVLETYGPSMQQYVRHGTIASVGVFTTSDKQDYEAQFQYALQNSDGVMVFDYAGLLKKGY